MQLTLGNLDQIGRRCRALPRCTKLYYKSKKGKTLIRIEDAAYHRNPETGERYFILSDGELADKTFAQTQRAEVSFNKL